MIDYGSPQLFFVTCEIPWKNCFFPLPLYSFEFRVVFFSSTRTRTRLFTASFTLVSLNCHAYFGMIIRMLLWRFYFEYKVIRLQIGWHLVYSAIYLIAGALQKEMDPCLSHMSFFRRWTQQAKLKFEPGSPIALYVLITFTLQRLNYTALINSAINYVNNRFGLIFKRKKNKTNIKNIDV